MASADTLEPAAETQMKKIATVLLTLSSACTQTQTDRVMPPFSAYGVWTSPAGFRLTIRRDGTYEFCDGRVCQEQTHSKLAQEQLILKDFFLLSASHRFIELAEPWPLCTKGICYTLPSGTPVTHDDMVFFDSVADQDAADICGEKECTIVGDVEAKGGLLVKQANG